MTWELVSFLIVMAAMMGMLFWALRRADKQVEHLLSDLDDLKRRPP